MMEKLYEWSINLLRKRFNFDARYFVKGGFWLVTGQVIALIIGIGTTALFAHYLSETDYGIYRYLIGLAVIFSSFSLTGVDQSILQAAAKKYYGFYRETIKISFFYNAPVVISALAGAIYYFYKDNSVLAIGCTLIAILQPAINTFQFIPSFLQGSKKFKEAAILVGIRTTFISLASLLALIFSQNILILLSVYLFSTTLANAVSYLYYKSNTPTPTPTDVFTKYLSYAKHNSVRNIISNIAFRADSVLVFTQLGAMELASYSIALIIPEQIKGTFKSLATLLLPKYAKYSSIHEIKNSIPKRSFQFFALLSFISLVYIFIAPILYSIIFPKYESAILYSQIVALSFPAVIALIPLNALQSQLKEKNLHILNTLGSIIMLASTFIGIVFYGLIGAIFAKVFYRYVIALITYIVIYSDQSKT